MKLLGSSRKFQQELSRTFKKFPRSSCSFPREQKRSHRSHRVPVCSRRRSESLLPSGLWSRHLRGGRGVPGQSMVGKKIVLAERGARFDYSKHFFPSVSSPRPRFASPRHSRAMARSHMHLDHAVTPVGFAPSLNTPPPPKNKIKSVPRSSF